MHNGFSRRIKPTKSLSLAKIRGTMGMSREAICRGK